MEKIKQYIYNHIPNLTSEEQIKIDNYIFKITEKIKSICARPDFPEELNYLAIQYAEDCYYYYKDIDKGNNEISSMSDNGQTVTYKSEGKINKDKVDLNKVIEENSAEISLYAYARW